MKVAVVGSYREDQTLLRNKEDFAEACESVGRKLAEWNHMLIIPHAEHENTAEAHALHGFKKASPYHYYKCQQRAGDPVLKAHFDAVEMSDAVILIGGQNGTYASGLGALRRRKIIVTIPVFGGSARDLCEIPEIDHMLVDEIRNLEVGVEGWTKKLTEAVGAVLNTFPRILIIHGRGDSGNKLKKKIFDESQIETSPLYGIAEPQIMDLSGMGAISVPDVFEDLASEVTAAITIVTADDVGGFARTEGREYSAKELKLVPRARENVWVEVGWFWGRLGRQRVFLWLQDEIDLPSDLQGAAWTYADTLENSWDSIKAFMANLRNPPD